MDKNSNESVPAKKKRGWLIPVIILGVLAVLAAVIALTWKSFGSEIWGKLNDYQTVETLVPPTCTEPGLVLQENRWGKTQVVSIPARGHLMTHSEGKEATCTETGLREYYFCERCSLFFEDEAGEKPLSGRQETVIPALGHVTEKHDEVPSTCTTEGTKAHWYCLNCGLFYTDEACENPVDPDDLALPRAAHEFKDGVCVRCGQPDEYTEGVFTFRAVTPEYDKGGSYCELVRVAADAPEELTVPKTTERGDEVYSIAGDAFKACRNLRTVTVPKANYRENCFRCDSLELVLFSYSFDGNPFNLSIEMWWSTFTCMEEDLGLAGKRAMVKNGTRYIHTIYEDCGSYTLNFAAQTDSADFAGEYSLDGYWGKLPSYLLIPAEIDGNPVTRVRLFSTDDAETIEYAEGIEVIEGAFEETVTKLVLPMSFKKADIDMLPEDCVVVFPGTKAELVQREIRVNVPVICSDGTVTPNAQNVVLAGESYQYENFDDFAWVISVPFLTEEEIVIPEVSPAGVEVCVLIDGLTGYDPARGDGPAPMMKKLFLPKSITHIGAHSVLATLDEISYAGTAAEWKEIGKSENWFGPLDGLYYHIMTVRCTDGIVEYNSGMSYYEPFKDAMVAKMLVEDQNLVLETLVIPEIAPDGRPVWEFEFITQRGSVTADTLVIPSSVQSVAIDGSLKVGAVVIDGEGSPFEVTDGKLIETATGIVILEIAE